MIWFYAPVEHYNKPLTMEIRKKNKWRACLLMVFYEIIDLLCMAKWPRISNVIMICSLEVVILMLWGERRRRHYEVKTQDPFQVYGTYQHAVKNISLSNSKKYTIGAGGMGDVLNFTSGYSSYYDNTGGVMVRGSLDHY